MTRVNSVALGPGRGFASVRGADLVRSGRAAITAGGGVGPAGGKRAGGGVSDAAGVNAESGTTVSVIVTLRPAEQSRFSESLASSTKTPEGKRMRYARIASQSFDDWAAFQNAISSARSSP